MKPTVNTKREYVIELEQKVELYKDMYAELYSYLHDIQVHLLGPNWYSYSMSGRDCAQDIRDQIIAKYKKVKR